MGGWKDGVMEECGWMEGWGDGGVWVLWKVRGG